MSKILAFLLLSLTLVGGDTKSEEYHRKYLENMDTGLKCHIGFKGLSPRIKDAADKCAKEDLKIASYLCFVLCTYRQFEYIVPGQEGDLDFGMADLVTMESFDMNTREGRLSYIRIALSRYNCGIDYIIHRNSKFAYTYNDASKCAASEEFFTCSWRALIFAVQSESLDTGRQVQQPQAQQPAASPWQNGFQEAISGITGAENTQETLQSVGSLLANVFQGIAEVPVMVINAVLQPFTNQQQQQQQQQLLQQQQLQQQQQQQLQLQQLQRLQLLQLLQQQRQHVKNSTLQDTNVPAVTNQEYDNGALNLIQQLPLPQQISTQQHGAFQPRPEAEVRPLATTPSGGDGEGDVDEPEDADGVGQA